MYKYTQYMLPWVMGASLLFVGGVTLAAEHASVTSSLSSVSTAEVVEDIDLNTLHTALKNIDQRTNGSLPSSPEDLIDKEYAEAYIRSQFTGVPLSGEDYEEVSSVSAGLLDANSGDKIYPEDINVISDVLILLDSRTSGTTPKRQSDLVDKEYLDGMIIKAYKDFCINTASNPESMGNLHSQVSPVSKAFKAENINPSFINDLITGISTLDARTNASVPTNPEDFVDKEYLESIVNTSVAACEKGLPKNMVITSCTPTRHLVVSTQDNDYAPQDGTNEATLIDHQGMIDNGGNQITFDFPYTAKGENILSYEAFTTTVTVPANNTEDGNARDLTLSYPAGTSCDPLGLECSSIITATVTVSDDGILKPKKLDINDDADGLELAKFDLFINQGGETRPVIINAMPAVIDANFGDGVHDFVYSPVASNDCKIYLQTDLGAEYSNTNSANFDLAATPTSATDHLAYGSLFQWGRPADGHELRTCTDSNTCSSINGSTAVQNTTITPVDALFVTGTDWTAADEHETERRSFLEKTDGAGICPVGYRVPTAPEISNIRINENIVDSNSLFQSSLKGVSGGYANADDFVLTDIGTVGKNWNDAPFRHLHTQIDDFSVTQTKANHGMSVRCIKQETDTDEDGLIDIAEALLGSDPNNPDTDGGGITDGNEVNFHATDPTAAYNDERCNFSTPMITKWNIDGDKELKLPLVSGYTYDFTVDWGDGTPLQRITSFNDENATHIYSTDGIYTVTITGMLKHFRAYQGLNNDRTRLLEVIELGDTCLTDTNQAFRGTTNLEGFAGGDLSEVVNMNSMFYQATSVDPQTTYWDTSNNTSFYATFYRTPNADPDTSYWDTSRVNTMQNMFYVQVNTDSIATPDTSNWDTSAVTNMNGMFYCTYTHSECIANPDVSNWDTSNVSNMQSLFKGQRYATPDVSNWDTSKVWNMKDMFASAVIADPDVSAWDVSKVTTMAYMFYNAENADPDVSAWDVSKANNMQNMFSDTEVANPDVSNWDMSNVLTTKSMFQNTDSANPNTTNWDTSSVTDMQNMFYNTDSANPDTSNWDTGNVTTMANMFSGASLANPDTTNWDTGNVTTMANMFHNASLANPDTSNWDTSSVTNMFYMFSGADSANPDTSNWDTSSVTNMYFMFSGADSANPNTTNWDTSSVTNMSYMFSGASLANPNTTNWDTGNVTTMANMFHNASLANPDTSNWDTGNVTTMANMFSGADSANPDTSNWDTGNVTTMSAMFSGADSANPNTTNWDTGNVTTMSTMFYNVASADPDTSNWDTSNVTSMLSMFYGATSADPDTSGWDTGNVTTMATMFLGAVSADPDVNSWDTGNVTSMNSMFNGASLANPDTTNWDTGNVTTMSAMFYNVASADPDTSNWDTSNVTSMASMFYGATSADPDVSNWDTGNVTSMNSMFYRASSFINHDLSAWDVSSVTNHTNFSLNWGTGNTEPIW